MPPDPGQPPGELPRRSRRAARAAEAEDSSWADLMGVQRGSTPEPDHQRDDAPGAAFTDPGFWGGDAGRTPAPAPSRPSAEPPPPAVTDAFRGWLSDAGHTEPVRTEAARTEAARTEAARTEGARTEAARTEAAQPSGAYQPAFDPAAPGRRPLPRRERARSSDDLLGGAGSQPPGSPAEIDPTRPWWAPGSGGPNPGGLGSGPGAGATVLPGGTSRGDLFALHPADGGQPPADSWYRDGHYGNSGRADRPGDQQRDRDHQDRSPAARGSEPAIPAPPPQVPVAPMPLDSAPSGGLPRRKPSNLSELTPPPGLTRPGDPAGTPEYRYEPEFHRPNPPVPPMPPVPAMPMIPPAVPPMPVVPPAASPQLPPPLPAPQFPASQFPAPQFPAPQFPSPQFPAPQAPSPQLPSPQFPAPEAPSPQLPSPPFPAPDLPRRQPAGSAPVVPEAPGPHDVPAATTAAGLPQRRPPDADRGVGEAQRPVSNPLRELEDPPPISFAEVLNPGSTGSIRRPLGGYTPPRRSSQSASPHRAPPDLVPYPEPEPRPEPRPSRTDAPSRRGSSSTGASSSSAAASAAGAAASTAAGAAAKAAATGGSAAVTAAAAQAAAHTAAGAAAASAASGAGAGAAAVIGSVAKAARRPGSAPGSPARGQSDETGTTMLPVTRRRRDSLEGRSGRGKKDRNEKASETTAERLRRSEHESYGPPPVSWEQPLPAAPAVPAVAPEDHGRAGRNLPAAIGVGLLLAGLALASLFTRPEAFVALVCLVVVLAVWELAGAMAAKQIIVPVIPLAVGAVGMLVSAYVAGEEGLLISFALTGVGVLLWRILEGVPGASRDVTAGIFTAAYVPLLAGFAILLLADPDGPLRVVTFILVTVCSDIGGYVAGVLAGRHPMAPTISPKKSWEGFAGSVIACLISGTVCVIFLLDGQWWVGLALGVASAISATVGDLSESLIKRDLGVKDMGSLLPGHGGIMDRLDSLLPTAPLAFLLLHFLVT